MNKKTVPFTSEQLENIIAQYPTPFHIYDEEGIIENMKSFINAFSWNKGFKLYFAVKATPNPYIMRLLQKLGVGADCSSLAELLLCEKVGITGHDIMFTSNDTPYVEYKKALEMGAIINLDDITHIEYLEKNHGFLPDTFCVRYNPGSLKEGGNTIIGLPEEAKYGMTREQIFEAYKQLQAKGVKHFGIHTMVVSNELDIDGLVGTAELCFNLAVDIKKELGITVEFIDLGGGVGVAYKPEQTPVDFRVLSKGVEEAYNRILVANGLNDVALAYECGRMVTGPFGYLVSTAIHKKDIYRHYIGLDACMANLMRPALYGSYHHITVMGKENAPKDNDTLTDEAALKIIQKLVKQGKDSAEIYIGQGRQDLADGELAQVAVMEAYLPKQMTAEELEAALKEIIAETGATSGKDMGKVMGVASKKLAGLAEGRAISAKVKELLG